MENRILMPNLRATAWDVAKTGAVAAHMSVADRVLYGDLYDGIATQYGVMQGEYEAWRQLGRYSGKMTLNPDEAHRLKEDLGMVRGSVAARRYNTTAFEQRIRALGSGRNPRICRPAAPLATSANRRSWPRGHPQTQAGTASGSS